MTMTNMSLLDAGSACQVPLSPEVPAAVVSFVSPQQRAALSHKTADLFPLPAAATLKDEMTETLSATPTDSFHSPGVPAGFGELLAMLQPGGNTVNELVAYLQSYQASQSSHSEDSHTSSSGSSSCASRPSSPVHEPRVKKENSQISTNTSTPLQYFTDERQSKSLSHDSVTSIPLSPPSAAVAASVAAKLFAPSKASNVSNSAELSVVQMFASLGPAQQDAFLRRLSSQQLFDLLREVSKANSTKPEAAAAPLPQEPQLSRYPSGAPAGDVRSVLQALLGAPPPTDLSTRQSLQPWEEEGRSWPKGEAPVAETAEGRLSSLLTALNQIGNNCATPSTSVEATQLMNILLQANQSSQPSLNSFQNIWQLASRPPNNPDNPGNPGDVVLHLLSSLLLGDQRHQPCAAPAPLSEPHVALAASLADMSASLSQAGGTKPSLDMAELTRSLREDGRYMFDAQMRTHVLPSKDVKSKDKRMAGCLRRGTTEYSCSYPGVSWNTRMQSWLVYFEDAKGRKSRTFNPKRLSLGQLELLPTEIRTRYESDPVEVAMHCACVYAARVRWEGRVRKSLGFQGSRNQSRLIRESQNYFNRSFLGNPQSKPQPVDEYASPASPNPSPLSSNISTPTHQLKSEPTSWPPQPTVGNPPSFIPPLNGFPVATRSFVTRPSRVSQSSATQPLTESSEPIDFPADCAREVIDELIAAGLSSMNDDSFRTKRSRSDDGRHSERSSEGEDSNQDSEYAARRRSAKQQSRLSSSEPVLSNDDTKEKLWNLIAEM